MIFSYTNYKKRRDAKILLSDMLQNPKYPKGRKLSTLSETVEMTKEDTENLLTSIGARKVILKGKKTGYTLRKKKV